MPGKQFSGWGRQQENDQGDPQWGFGYAGEQSGELDQHLDVGLGLYNSDHFDLLQANGQLGVWSDEENQARIGARGEASTIGAEGSLGDFVGLFTGEESEEDQGGWQNFLEGEVHGPSANAEMSIGNDGLDVGAGWDMGGGSATLGGAEYDWLLGTEISAGAGYGGAGANFGLDWSDDDGDGITEFGVSLGGMLGIGGDIGIKTEAFGHAANAIGDAWDWLTE